MVAYSAHLYSETEIILVPLHPRGNQNSRRNLPLRLISPPLPLPPPCLPVEVGPLNAATGSEGAL